LAVLPAVEQPAKSGKTLPINNIEKQIYFFIQSTIYSLAEESPLWDASLQIRSAMIFDDGWCFWRTHMAIISVTQEKMESMSLTLRFINVLPKAKTVVQKARKDLPE
jgi:hypothetical protein